MPNRDDWDDRIKGVETEYVAVRRAVDLFQKAVAADRTILPGDLRPRDINTASHNLESTYVIRLFAEFETALRDFWRTTPRGTQPRTQDLIDAVAARCRIDDMHRLNVHSMREYRNGLVHERDDPADPIPIREVRSKLCIFFRRLPPRW